MTGTIYLFTPNKMNFSWEGIIEFLKIKFCQRGYCNTESSQKSNWGKRPL